MYKDLVLVTWNSTASCTEKYVASQSHVWKEIAAEINMLLYKNPQLN